MSTTVTVTIDTPHFVGQSDATRALITTNLSKIQGLTEIVIDAAQVERVSDTALDELFRRFEDMHPGVRIKVVSDHTGDIGRHLAEREATRSPTGAGTWMTGFSDLQRAQLLAPETVEGAAKALDPEEWKVGRNGHPIVEAHREKLRAQARAVLAAALAHVAAEAGR